MKAKRSQRRMPVMIFVFSLVSALMVAGVQVAHADQVALKATGAAVTFPDGDAQLQSASVSGTGTITYGKSGVTGVSLDLTVTDSVETNDTNDPSPSECTSHVKVVPSPSGPLTMSGHQKNLAFSGKVNVNVLDRVCGGIAQSDFEEGTLQVTMRTSSGKLNFTLMRHPNRATRSSYAISLSAQ